ncbi:hypothetical protein N1851_028389 [Merluccius polli]|uniref:DUF4537 domain-containing protein n=1 Tax=Merluccius polli TaxID=89951 RepID=A0AA47M8Q0_MERPO|nr:hypothetical protein N1851_028389 [Merluccius polli]
MCKLNRWSQSMVPCAPHTVYKALSWVHSLTCGPGRDLLAALSTALMDPNCHTVHLVTTGLPCHTDAVLRALPTVAGGRTVNVFYPLDHSSASFNSEAPDFLQCLALATGGSCYLIPVGFNGALIGKVVPFQMTESHMSVSSPCPGKSVHNQSIHIPNQHTSHPLYRCSLGNHLVTSCVPCDLTPYSSSSSISMRYFPGCRVLTRRQQDGLYYLGTIVQECQRGLWLVELDHLESSSTVSRQQLQLVCSLDMINHTGAHAHRLVPGDAVMSPWEPGVRRYGPGVVTAEMEHQDSLSVADGGGTSLWVQMWSECVALVPSSLVVHIPSSVYSRLVRELQQGVTASHSWPCTATPPWAYPRGCQSASATCYHHPIPCHWPSTCACDLGSGDGWERAELEKQASLLLENLAATETARSKSSLSMAEGVTIRVRPKRDQNRPPWRYWRRTPEPQHRKSAGTPVPRRALQPARFSFPVLQVNLSPNHSSMFKTVPGSVRRADIREVFEGTDFKPRPPAGSPTNAPTAVHTRMN